MAVPSVLHFAMDILHWSLDIFPFSPSRDPWLLLMLDFADQPYRWFPPRRNALIAALVALFNRKVRLPRDKQVMAVRVEGDVALREKLQPGDRLLFMPNHSTHADPETLLESLRQAGFTTLTMAAYDVFLRNRFHAWLIQFSGGFSVDREGSDAKALKVAKETLTRGKHGLTLFPEGNVYLQNDLVTPFHEGAAMIALRTARELIEKKVRVLAVPMSMKYSHLTDARAAVTARLHELAAALQLKLAAEESPVELVRRVGMTALHRNLKHRGIDSPQIDDLPALIEAAAEKVLTRLEAKLGHKVAKDDTLIERVRKARRTIHQVRLDPQRHADHVAAVGWADEAMLAFKIVSYNGRYFSEKPTLDRYAETIEKLEEDVTSTMPKPFGPREAIVRFNEPLDVTARVAAFEEKARAAVTELTRDAERAVQSGIDAINEVNRLPGGVVRV